MPSGSPPRLVWNPESGLLDSRADGADALIHLAGASIAGHRWTEAWKRELRESRVAATHRLIASLAPASTARPQILIAASAIGFYGNRGDEELTESSPAGSDFLARVTRRIGKQNRPARRSSAPASSFCASESFLPEQGGALPRMAFPFRLGVGGRIGSGRQWMSWVTLEDVVGIIRFALETNLLSGPANVVAPNPVQNSRVRRRLWDECFTGPQFSRRLLSLCGWLSAKWPIRCYLRAKGYIPQSSKD